MGCCKYGTLTSKSYVPISDELIQNVLAKECFLIPLLLKYAMQLFAINGLQAKQCLIRSVFPLRHAKNITCSWFVTLLRLLLTVAHVTLRSKYSFTKLTNVLRNATPHSRSTRNPIYSLPALHALRIACLNNAVRPMLLVISEMAQ